jgi:hypothetical protein
MSISPAPRRSNQLPLFARPQRNPHWTDLSSDVQQKIVQLLMQLLRQHRNSAVKAAQAKEAHDE